MVETAARLAFSERRGMPVADQRIRQFKGFFAGMKCDLNPDIISLFNATDHEPKLCTHENS